MSVAVVVEVYLYGTINTEVSMRLGNTQMSF